MVRVLSYNILFKAMLIPGEISLNLFNKKCFPIVDDQINNLKYTTCLKNVSQIIETNGPYDFVCLQEATNWNIIRRITPCLQPMNYISSKFDVEEIITFYDKTKYVLDDSQYLLEGYMADVNRPFHILFFNNNLCAINLHAGHYTKINNTKMKDIYGFNQYLEEFLSKNKKADKYLTKLNNYDMMMVGDFNDKLSNITEFKVLDRILYGINKIPTCCDFKLSASNHHNAYDHILSNMQIINSTIVPVSNASDHLPIIVTLSKNIGYDFDGVLHTDVDTEDSEGQRHAINSNGPYHIFNEMVDQIEKDIVMDHKIYIITSRTNESNSTIKKHLLSTKLKSYIKDISVLFSNGESKVNLLHQYNINAFYDDSCLRIIELYNAKTNGDLPRLSQIYFTNPDNHAITLIDQNNIVLFCPKYLLNELNNKLEFLDEKNIATCVNIILQLINKYNYRFSNRSISRLLKKLNNGIDNQTINLTECLQLQRDIIQLIGKQINKIQ